MKTFKLKPGTGYWVDGFWRFARSPKDGEPVVFTKCEKRPTGRHKGCDYMGWLYYDENSRVGLRPGVRVDFDSNLAEEVLDNA